MCLGCTWGHLHGRLKITYRAGNIYLLDLQQRCWLQLQWVVISLCHWIWSQTIFFASSYCCEFPLSRAIGCPEINRGLLFHLASLKILFPHVHRLAFYFKLDFLLVLVVLGFILLEFHSETQGVSLPFTHISNTCMDFRPCMELPIMLFSHRYLLKNKDLVHILFQWA